MYKTRGSNGLPDDDTVGSGRFARKPRATLARIAQSVEQDDARPLTDEEAKDLISYLSMATRLGGMTFRQMDAFWELNRQLLKAHAELRDFYEERPAFDDGQYKPREESAARRWMSGLSEKDYAVVVEAAYAQFGTELPGEPEEGSAPSGP